MNKLEKQFDGVPDKKLVVTVGKISIDYLTVFQQ